MTDTPPPKRPRGRPSGKLYPHRRSWRLDDEGLDAVLYIQDVHGFDDESAAMRTALRWYRKHLEELAGGQEGEK
jgi:hypothetical protein